MKILPDPIEFEWDKGNTDKNFKKHNVTNKETENVFLDEDTIVFEDFKHSQQEKRHGMFGKTSKGRYLAIVFTVRINKIRIITARDMSKKERSAYEKKNSKQSQNLKVKMRNAISGQQ